jgi:N-acetyltransferase
MAVVGGFAPEPVTLVGTVARLEPLGHDHAEPLLTAGRDPAIWRYLPTPQPRSLDDASSWIDDALAEQAAGRQLPFAIVHLESGRAVGSTRYLEIRPPHKGLEIGWTWLDSAVQRTGVNTECKLLLLRHAFEDLGALRVQLKTDSRNIQSQRAIERIGAFREGVLRAHMIMWDGVVRDSVYYSIVSSEWPAIRERLLGMMQASDSR